MGSGEDAADATGAAATRGDSSANEGSGARHAAARTASAVPAKATTARAAVPTADGETSLVRALGLKVGRIVIDAGHGGHDSGTLGVDGIQEKDVVLEVALRVGKIAERSGQEARVIQFIDGVRTEGHGGAGVQQDE